MVTEPRPLRRGLLRKANASPADMLLQGLYTNHPPPRYPLLRAETGAGQGEMRGPGPKRRGSMGRGAGRVKAEQALFSSKHLVAHEAPDAGSGLGGGQVEMIIVILHEWKLEPQRG